MVSHVCIGFLSFLMFCTLKLDLRVRFDRSNSGELEHLGDSALTIWRVFEAPKKKK